MPISNRSHVASVCQWLSIVSKLLILWWSANYSYQTRPLMPACHSTSNLIYICITSKLTVNKKICFIYLSSPPHNVFELVGKTWASNRKIPWKQKTFRTYFIKNPNNVRQTYLAFKNLVKLFNKSGNNKKLKTKVNKLEHAKSHIKRLSLMWKTSLTYSELVCLPCLLCQLLGLFFLLWQLFLWLPWLHI